MPLGYRHFVVVGDDITRLSQKALRSCSGSNALGSRRSRAPRWTLSPSSMWSHTVRPAALVRIDCERWTIRDDGTLDAQDREERARLTRYQMDRAFRHILPSAPHTGGTVIDARARFDEKRLRDTLTPTLSAIAMQKMIASLWR